MYQEAADIRSVYLYKKFATCKWGLGTRGGGNDVL